MEGFPLYPAELEIRARGSRRSLRGSFPYRRQATVRSRGRVRKERIEPDAFGWQLREFERVQAEFADWLKQAESAARAGRLAELEEQLERRNVHILSGHSFDKPLGDMKRGTARVTSSNEALAFEVDLPDEADMPTYMLDTVKEIRTGRAGGISPGFQVPPARVVPNAETLEPEPGNEAVQVRVIRQAVLHEISIVSRPAYGSTDVDLRRFEGAEMPVLRPNAGGLFL